MSDSLKSLRNIDRDEETDKDKINGWMTLDFIFRKPPYYLIDMESSPQHFRGIIHGRRTHSLPY